MTETCLETFIWHYLYIFCFLYKVIETVELSCRALGRPLEGVSYNSFIE